MDLESGYRIKYDPFTALERLKSDKQSALNELWENLYHQGEIGTASYAAVPKLVEAGELDLVASIEVARQNESNPEIPLELRSEYFEALNTVLKSTPESPEQLKGFYTIHASVHENFKLAKALDLLDADEIINEYG
ncbi:hypothetical protein [Motilimonas sp. E26]|uniref:hypothetical protein n=1 Tax=Motilimonas sp. E26 TaxID=2865674 RepID=UPI001E442C89|nr:hypothetical protein [Motilimonas sp. E26]MCE0558461.1 hypothetical protein [Motilimonas sp. E26]